MADEIKVSESINIVNGNYKELISPGTINITQAAVGGGSPGTITIGQAAEEDISFGDVVPGVVWMQNLDTTNYIQIGPKSGGVMVPCVKLAAGKSVRIYLDTGVTLRAKANTADCKVLIKGYNA